MLGIWLKDIYKLDYCCYSKYKRKKNVKVNVIQTATEDLNFYLT